MPKNRRIKLKLYDKTSEIKIIWVSCLQIRQIHEIEILFEYADHATVTRFNIEIFLDQVAGNPPRRRATA